MSASGAIQPHNERRAAVWSPGSVDYDQISRGIARIWPMQLLADTILVKSILSGGKESSQ